MSDQSDDVHISTVFRLGPDHQYYHLVASFIDEEGARDLIKNLNAAIKKIKQATNTADDLKARAGIMRFDPGFKEFCKRAAFLGKGDILPYYGWDIAPLKFST